MAKVKEFNKLGYTVIFWIVFALLVAGAVSYRYLTRNSCYSSFQIAMVDPTYNGNTPEKWFKINDLCQKAFKESDFGERELYTMYILIKHIDEHNYASRGVYTKDRYHHYLYFANIHGGGKYDVELKKFENSMSRREKARAFDDLSFFLTREENLKFFSTYDYEEAFRLLVMAARLGKAGAQSSLGLSYAVGEFRQKYKVKKDLVEAYKWLYLSVYLGYDVTKGLEEVRKAIKRENIKDGISRGQVLANQWLEENKDWLDEARDIAKEEMKQRKSLLNQKKQQTKSEK